MDEFVRPSTRSGIVSPAHAWNALRPPVTKCAQNLGRPTAVQKARHTSVYAGQLRAGRDRQRVAIRLRMKKAARSEDLAAFEL